MIIRTISLYLIFVFCQKLYATSANKFCESSTCDRPNLDNMFALVTGGNAGMGLATAIELAKLGYFVTITARNSIKGEEAVKSILEEVPTAKVQHLNMELKDLSTVRICAQEYLVSGLPLHVLVNNAGIMNTPYEMTVDGFEAQFQVNHLGHFLFAHFLLPRIRESSIHQPGRIINLSSRAHLRWSGPLVLTTVKTETPETYDGWTAYGRSKLSNILFTRALAQRTEGENIRTYSLHPGLVDTGLLQVVPGLNKQAIPITEGIQTTLYLITTPENELVNGEYYYEKQIMTESNQISSAAKSLSDAEILWQNSLEYVGLTEEEYGH
jgi:NAD(P)-dependent dehydrogenase (short-subunit alcohol dehydrogenase family)